MKVRENANITQKDYYNKLAEEKLSTVISKSPNLATAVWTSMRVKFNQYRADIGIEKEIIDQQIKWLRDANISSSRVLEIGCFQGTNFGGFEMSKWIIENSKEYVGIDLSEKAINAYQDHTISHYSNAKAYSMDILANDFSSDYFDIIYCPAVLHHFNEIDRPLREFKKILRAGGSIISFDPLATSFLNRALRNIYRPFQKTREWEFPFTENTIKSIKISQ